MSHFVIIDGVRYVPAVIDQPVNYTDVRDKAIELSCEHFGITVEQLKSESRLRNLVDARSICFKVISECSTTTLTRIGEDFGKNHATVLHGTRKAQNLIETDKEFRNAFEKIKNIVKSEFDIE